MRLLVSIEGHRLAFALIVLLSSACSPLGASSSYTVDTAPSGPRLTARLEGVLGGQVRLDGSACFWIDNGGTRTALVWPQGYSGAKDPLRIRDYGGKTLAQVGQHIAVGGGLGPTRVGCGAATAVWIV